MPRSYAAIEYVHSRVMPNYSQVVDLRWSISIHSCEVCPFQSSNASSPFLCQAIHYGICTPIRRSLIRNQARLQQPSKHQIDTPVHILQGTKTCRRNGSTKDPLDVLHNSQATPDNDGVSFLHLKRIELLQRREQERKQLRTALKPEFQHNVTPTAGDSTTTTSGSGDASISSLDATPSRLPTNPTPLTAGNIIEPIATTATSTLTPSMPLTTLNNFDTSVVLSSPNGILSHTYPASTASVLVPPYHSFGTSTTCLASMAPHNGLAVKLSSSSPAVVVSTSSVSTSSPISIALLIAELETLSLSVSEISLSSADNIKPGRYSTSSNTVDSFPRLHDMNSNKVEPEKFNDATRPSGQTYISRESSRLEPPHCSSIPQFYFPAGRSSETVMSTDVLLSQVEKVFEKAGGIIKAEQMVVIVKACGLPLYWKCPLFRYAGGENDGTLSLQSFLVSWKKLSEGCQDSASMFVCILAKSDQNYLEFDDFVPFVQDVIDTHPGLAFLGDAVEFHSRYIQTVIARIFYTVNRSWSGQITLQEIRKSNLLQTICYLEEEEDINQIVDYFSYEHFYVIYCKFWELDLDHDFLLSKTDLLRHNDQAINGLIVDRIFSGAVTRKLVDGKLSFPDFVWFLISEEDKRHPRSMEYWFRCMDLDGDGILSMYELECLYTEQVEKMDLLGIDVLPFCDCLCQMFDMIQPKEEGKIRLSDLKSCSLAPTFFDTFINLDKYLEHEQRDPFTSLQDPIGDQFQITDWERFAALEYEMLLAENNSSDYYQEEILPLKPAYTQQKTLLSSTVTEPLTILSNKPIVSYSDNIWNPEAVIQSITELS